MTTAELDEMQVPEGVRPDILCFLLPFLAFIGTILIIFFQTGALNLGPSVLIGFAVSVANPIAKGYFKFEEVPGLIYQGAKSMVPYVSFFLWPLASARLWRPWALQTLLYLPQRGCLPQSFCLPWCS